MALCEIQWIVEFNFPTKEVNHVDEVFDITVASGTSFGKLDFAIDTFQYSICNACFDEVNDARPMHSDGFGESHKCRNFGLFDFIAPVGQERGCGFLVWHFP